MHRGRKMGVYQEKTISKQEAEEVNKAYKQLSSYYDSVMRSYKDMLYKLIAQKDAVQQINTDLTSATHNTHIGANQCREALSFVIKKLDKAIERLSNL